MTIKLELRGLDEFERQVRAIVTAGEEIGKEAPRVEQESLGHMIQGAQVNIYDTTPGAYQRTFELLQGLRVSAKGTRGRINVALGNDTEYAGDVEIGDQSPQGILSDALRRTPSDIPEAMTYGRSGVDYHLAGPIIIPATVFAVYRARELFVKRVKELQR